MDCASFTFCPVSTPPQPHANPWRAALGSAHGYPEYGQFKPSLSGSSQPSFPESLIYGSGLHLLVVLVLIQQKLAVSRGKARRDIWGSLTTGSVACSLAPWGLMSGIGPRSSVSAPRRQFLAPLGAHRPVSFGGRDYGEY